MRLEARDVRLEYADGQSVVRAVDGVSIAVEPGEFVGLLGPSGSGKSSLLYLLAGLKSPTAGEVRVGDTRLDGLSPDAAASFRRSTFGFVFQNHFLVNYLTGLENVATGGAGDGARLLEELGVGHCRDKFPWQMSAGERQRVALARAVVHRPAILFADEPTASLDRPNAELVTACLRRVTKGGTLFVVTHDESIVRDATRVLRMASGRIQPPG
ncbi:MAG TPA: ABC transporter ATP-binding protein [Planctomycetota bacterium]|nr:ABC transporter ATP-binding protein [Planctomycetota bacterium]